MNEAEEPSTTITLGQLETVSTALTNACDYIAKAAARHTDQQDAAKAKKKGFKKKTKAFEELIDKTKQATDVVATLAARAEAAEDDRQAELAEAEQEEARQLQEQEQREQSYERKPPKHGQVTVIKAKDRANILNASLYLTYFENRMRALNQNPAHDARNLRSAFPSECGPVDQRYLAGLPTHNVTHDEWQQVKVGFVAHIAKDKTWSTAVQQLSWCRQKPSQQVEEYIQMFWLSAKFTVPDDAHADIPMEMLQRLPVYNDMLQRNLLPTVAAQMLTTPGYSNDVLTSADQLHKIAHDAEETLQLQKATRNTPKLVERPGDKHKQNREYAANGAPKVHCTNCDKTHYGGAAACRAWKIATPRGDTRDRQGRNRDRQGDRTREPHNDRDRRQAPPKIKKIKKLMFRTKNQQQERQLSVRPRSERSRSPEVQFENHGRFDDRRRWGDQSTDEDRSDDDEPLAGRR